MLGVLIWENEHGCENGRHFDSQGRQFDIL